MQSLCPKIRVVVRDLGQPLSLAWRVLRTMATLYLLAHTFSVSAQNQATTPYQALEIQVRHWAAQQPAFRGKDVGIAALDPRIPIQNCQQMLQFDQPFPGQPSVRVRCMLPSWQLFITLVNAASAPNATTTPSGPSTQKVWVAKTLLKRGTLLSPSMLVAKEVAPAGMENQLIQDPQQVANMELVRDLLPDTPLRTYDVKNAIMVKRGQDVLINVGVGQGFLITVKAEALQDGAMGETIRFKNTESGRSISAEITGLGTAKMK